MPPFYGGDPTDLSAVYHEEGRDYPGDYAQDKSIRHHPGSLVQYAG